MGNNIQTTLWYAENASVDKYVSCMSAYLEQIREQDVSVACKWLEVTANLDIKERWSNRRKYWLLVVRLCYAEWVKCEAFVHEVRAEASTMLEHTSDDYTRKMYQVIEANCYVSLYRISNGKVLPMFRQYHQRLLLLVDDLMFSQQDNIPNKSFVEDCSHIYDVIADIELICGAQLYQSTLIPIAKELGNTADIIEFKSKADKKVDKILDYLTHWLGGKHINPSNPLMKTFLKSVEQAKQAIDKRLGVSSEVLFSSEANSDTETHQHIRRARELILQALDNKGITRSRSSFWKLYIELVIQEAIELMGKEEFNQINNEMALRQAARWPLHEKMHEVIYKLASEPEYLEHLIKKKIIHSESLLYGVFSTLAMKKVGVVYCGYDIVNADPRHPEFRLHCHNGKGTERIYKELISSVYKVTYCKVRQGFCLRLSPETGLDKMPLEYACICTGRQMVMVGIPKQFELEAHCYQASKSILSELFNLVGFDFSTTQALLVRGPSTPEISAVKIKNIELEKANVHVTSHFIDNFIETNIPPANREDRKTAQSDYYFDEMIEVVQGA